MIRCSHKQRSTPGMSIGQLENRFLLISACGRTFKCSRHIQTWRNGENELGLVLPSSSNSARCSLLSAARSSSASSRSLSSSAEWKRQVWAMKLHIINPLINKLSDSAAFHQIQPVAKSFLIIHYRAFKGIVNRSHRDTNTAREFAP